MKPAGGGRAVSAILAVLIVAVLAGDAAVVLSRQDDDAGKASTPAPGDRREATTPEARELEAALPELEAFVEQSRGLKFTSRPKVELLDDEAFEALLLETDEEAEAEGEIDEDAIVGLLRALGLIDGDIDLDDVGEQQVADVVGFYDDHTKRLYARGVAPTPYVKQVLVHELTHALEDQRFGLRRDELDDEASAAFTALVEGSATLVEQRWFDSRPAGEQRAIEAEEDAGGFGGGDVPDVFVRLMSFPYAVGPDFVDAVLASGGQPRLDAAFAGPPTTTEQILHPERFLGGEGARAVAEPAAEGQVVDQGTIGEVGLILMLDSAVGHDTALRAAAGWGGDHYVAWRNAAGLTCVRFNLVMDTSRDTTEVVSALRAWAAANRGATVTGTSPIVVRNCG